MAEKKVVEKPISWMKSILHITDDDIAKMKKEKVGAVVSYSYYSQFSGDGIKIRTILKQIEKSSYDNLLKYIIKTERNDIFGDICITHLN